jgi:hypothetical protein
MAKYSDNPRENFLIDMMERQKNRTTPITVEDFLKQMGGLSSLGVTAEQLQQRFNEKPLENISNPSMLGKALTDVDIKQMYDNWKPYGSGDVKSNPAAEAKVAALNIPKREQPPQGMQAVDNSVISAPKSAGGDYKDGQVVTQNGIRYIAHGGKLLTQAEVVKDNNLFNKYSNLVSNQEIGDANGPPPAVIPPPPPVKPVGVNPANDPNNLPYNNPESNKPIFPTSYSGQISLPTDPTEIQLMDYLKKQFEDKTWENKYGELQKQYQALADRPDKYSGMIEKAGGEDVAGYIKSLYEGAADPLRREAQRMQEQNAADLASRGLGMSTVVNDVNNPVQRELLANLTDLSNRSNVQGRDMYLNALKSAADVYGQSNAQQGNILNAMQTNIGNQMGAQQIGLSNINDILAKQEARRLTNMQTGINQWDKDVANYWKYQYYPIDAYAGQNSTANTAAQVGSNQYNQATQNAATQNQTAGNVGSMLAQNMFKQPQNFTYQPISGGLAGAQQGAQAGFNTKPKPGAFNQ